MNRHLSFFVLVVWSTTALTIHGADGPDAVGEVMSRWDVKRLNAAEAEKLEGTIQKLYAQLAPSVVRIYDPKREGNFTGVIVSSSGEIFTTGHHPVPRGTKVMVELADGRKVKATILGRVENKSKDYYGTDVGAALLGEKGNWPAAVLGRTTDLKPGDLCLKLGFPVLHKPGQPPLLRLGRIISAHARNGILAACRVESGDSGGPLFDLNGRVFGVSCTGVNIEAVSDKLGTNWYSTVESFLKVRDRLLRGEEVIAAVDFGRGEDVQPAKDTTSVVRNARGGAWKPTKEYCKTLSSARESVVEVRDEGRVIALGLIVENDGWVLTKRTELMGPRGPRHLLCRLTDGRELETQEMGTSRQYDLALLKVSCNGLPAVRWGKSAKLSVGQLVASLSPNLEPLNCAVVGALRVKNPGTHGVLPFSIKAAPESTIGVAFAEFMPKERIDIDEFRGLLKPGDLITHLDDVPTPMERDFLTVQRQRLERANALAGEWIQLTLPRDGKARHVFLPLVAYPALPGPPNFPFPTYSWREARWNLRKDGFPNVFVHDGTIAYDRCGGPVVDRSGQVIGINIARADPMQTFAIPGDVVQQVIAEMKAQTQNRRLAAPDRQ